MDAGSWPTSRRTRRGRSCGEACCCSSSCCWSSSSRSSRHGRSSSGRRASRATSSSSSTPRRAWRATDVVPDRLTAAKAAAIEALRDLPDGRQGQRHRGGPDAPGSSSTARPTSGGSARRSTAIEVTAATGDLGDALGARRPLAARSGDAEILVATDAALAIPPTGRVDAPIQRPAGRARAQEPGHRRAGRAARRRRPSRGRCSSASPTSTSSAAEPAARGLGRRRPDRGPRPARSRRRRRAEVVIDDMPARRSASIEVRLVGAPTRRRPATPTSSRSTIGRGRSIPPDRTRLDPGRRRGRPVPRDGAARTCPNVELFGVEPAEYGRRRERTDGRPWDLIIFEGDLPATAARTRRSSRSRRRGRAPLGEVTGTLNEPGHRVARPGRADPALRRPVDDPHRRRRRSSPCPTGRGR